MNRYSTKLFLIALSSLAAPAFSGTWKTIQLNLNPATSYVQAVTVDDLDNYTYAAALCPSNCQLASSTAHSFGSAFPALSLIPSPYAGLSVHGPTALSTNLTGRQTIVYDTDTTGSYTGSFAVDRPRGGAWGPRTPITGLPRFYTWVLSNDAGDEAVAGDAGYAPHISSGPTVTAAFRYAGGTWGAAETIVANQTALPVAAGMGPDGTLAVAWESFAVTCGRYGCSTPSNFVLHVSIRSAQNNSWTDSGALLGPDNLPHGVALALDATGRVGLLAVSNGNWTTGNLVSIVRQNGVWGKAAVVAPASALNPTGPLSTFGRVLAYQSDASGHATFITLAASGFLGGAVISIDGSLATNAWSSITVLGGTGPGSYAAINSNGDAVAAWLASNSSRTQVVAATRMAGQPWSPPVIVASAPNPSIQGFIISSQPAISPGGRAVLSYWLAYTAGVYTVQNNYVAEYKP
jgi:hypothetical protein